MTSNIVFRSVLPEDYRDFLDIYNASFPPDERRVYQGVSGFEEFLQSKSGLFHILVAADGCSTGERPRGRMLGFLSYWTFPGFVYVEHFAVNPAIRGGGIGSRMLSRLIEAVSPDVLLEVELPDTHEAERRIAFYERHGFRVRREYKYIQPPYGPGQSGMELLLMTHGSVNLDDPGLIPLLHREVYGR